MLPPDDLHVHVLVVVAVQGRCGALVAQPEVDGVCALLEGDARPGDVGGDVGEEGLVFSAEVVVFWLLDRGLGLVGWDGFVWFGKEAC